MHRHVPVHLVGRVRLVMFNLGYLPGGDKSLTTTATETSRAIQSAIELIAPDGLICVLAYRGHPEGRAEVRALETVFETTRERVAWDEHGATPDPAPRLFVGVRKG